MSSLILTKTKKAKFLWEQYVVLLFLFLGAMNFITRYYYWFFIAFFLFCLLVKKIRLDGSLIWLLGLSLSILLFSKGATDSITNMLKPFVYPLCYLMGSGLLKHYKTNSEKETNENLIVKVLIILALGLLVHLLLNLFTNIGSVDRNTVDFWTKDTLSATGQTALSCLPIAMICACLFLKTKKWHKILAIIGLLLIMYYGLVLASRTIFVFIILEILFIVAYRFFTSKQKNNYIIKVIVFLGVAICGVALVYNLNLFNIKTIVMESNFYERFFGKWAGDIRSDKRFEYKILYLRNMWGNFLGGGNIYDSFKVYAHDLFLDTYDYAGIFALMSVVGYIIISFKRFWKCLKDKNTAFSFRLIVSCVYVIFYLEFMIEPILLGMQWLFALFCVFDGMICSYLEDRKACLIKRD